MKKRILFISESKDFISGAEKSMLEIISLFDKDKFECFIGKTTSKEFEDEIKKLKINQLPISLHENRGIIKYFVYIIDTIKVLKKHKIDLVYITSSGNYWKPAEIVSAKIAGIPVITHMRWWKYNVKKTFLKYSNKIICNSQFTAERLLKTKWRSKAIVIMNFVKLDKFLAKKKDYNKKKFQIGYVGQINPVKGLKYLIDAAEMLKKKKNIGFILVGRDAGAYPGYKKELERYAKKIPNIKFQDYTDDLNTIYQNTDIFVLPSIEEPFGRVLVEAGHFGIPCIATRVGGIPEVIEDNETGILVEPKNSEFIANEILKLVNNPALRKKLGEKAQDKILTDFNPKIQIKKIEEVCLQLIRK